MWLMGEKKQKKNLSQKKKKKKKKKKKTPRKAISSRLKPGEVSVHNSRSHTGTDDSEQFQQALLMKTLNLTPAFCKR